MLAMVPPWPECGSPGGIVPAERNVNHLPPYVTLIVSSRFQIASAAYGADDREAYRIQGPLDIMPDGDSKRQTNADSTFRIARRIERPERCVRRSHRPRSSSASVSANRAALVCSKVSTGETPIIPPGRSSRCYHAFQENGAKQWPDMWALIAERPGPTAVAADEKNMKTLRKVLADVGGPVWSDHSVIGFGFRSRSD